MDPIYPFWPIAFFLCLLMVLIPLPWHLQMWQVNTGICAYIIWMALALLNQFINSIVWKDNARNPHPVWCDISSRLIIGTSVAIPAASLCVSRCLYNIARGLMVTQSAKERRKGFIIDLSLCVGFPVIVMIWFYIVQGHRFNIIEEIGCFPATFNTPLAYFLVYMWPLILGVCGMIYCLFTIPLFVRLRRELSAGLGNSTKLTPSRYLRLLALVSMNTVITVPFAAYSIYANATETEPSPWKGWANAHLNFGRVSQVPALLWRQNPATVRAFDMTRAFLLVCAVIFFAFFGFASEARREYQKAFWAVAKRFGHYPKGYTTQASGTGAGSLPQWKQLNLSALSSKNSGGSRSKVDLSDPSSHEISLGDFKMYMHDGNGLQTLRSTTATTISVPGLPSSPVPPLPASHGRKLSKRDSFISHLTSIGELSFTHDGHIIDKDGSSIDLTPITPTCPRPPALTSSPSSSSTSSTLRDKPLPGVPPVSRPVSAVTADADRISISSVRRDVMHPAVATRVAAPRPGPPTRPPRPKTLDPNDLSIV